jgi:threonine-phosphate decarboxylase
MNEKAHPQNLLDFAQNTNPFVPPKHVYSNLGAQFSRIVATYVHPHAHPAHKKLASFLRVPHDCVTMVCGASEAIFNLPWILGIKSGIIFPPTFWQYRASLKQSGARVIVPKENKKDHDFRITSEVLFSLNSAADIAFVSNPDNPTSRLCSKDVLYQLLDHLGKGVLIVDETYLLFRQDFYEQSLMQAAVQQKNIIVLASMSKFFNIPGLRIGYVVAHPSVTKRIRNMNLCYSVNNIALFIVERLLDESKFISTSRTFIARERERVQKVISTLPGFNVIPADANFVFVTLPRGMGMKLRLHCEHEHIRPRWGTELDTRNINSFRVSIKDRHSNSILLNCLSKFANKTYNLHSIAPVQGLDLTGYV